MESFTAQERLMLTEHFSEPNYPQPHGDAVASQLLVAMIRSGKYELQEYPRLAEAAVKLAAILAVRCDREARREVRETTDPKSLVLERDTLSSDYDPIPF